MSNSAFFSAMRWPRVRSSSLILFLLLSLASQICCCLLSICCLFSSRQECLSLLSWTSYFCYFSLASARSYFSLCFSAWIQASFGCCLYMGWEQTKQLHVVYSYQNCYYFQDPLPSSSIPRCTPLAQTLYQNLLSFPISTPALENLAQSYRTQPIRMASPLEVNTLRLWVLQAYSTQMQNRGDIIQVGPSIRRASRLSTNASRVWPQDDYQDDSMQAVRHLMASYKCYAMILGRFWLDVQQFQEGTCCMTASSSSVNRITSSSPIFLPLASLSRSGCTPLPTISRIAAAASCNTCISANSASLSPGWLTQDWYPSSCSHILAYMSSRSSSPMNCSQQASSSGRIWCDTRATKLAVRESPVCRSRNLRGSTSPCYRHRQNRSCTRRVCQSQVYYYCMYQDKYTFESSRWVVIWGRWVPMDWWGSQQNFYRVREINGDSYCSS